MNKPPVLSRQVTVPLGSLLIVPGQALERWQVIATSANGKYFLVRRITLSGKEFVPANDLATVPIHRVSPHDKMIESGFWLSIFHNTATAPEGKAPYTAPAIIAEGKLGR